MPHLLHPNFSPFLASAKNSGMNQSISNLLITEKRAAEITESLLSEISPWFFPSNWLFFDYENMSVQGFFWLLQWGGWYLPAKKGWWYFSFSPFISFYYRFADTRTFLLLCGPRWDENCKAFPSLFKRILRDQRTGTMLLVNFLNVASSLCV